MTPHEIQRALRWITSKPQRQRFPIATLAQLAGISRQSIYKARAGQGLTERVVAVLSPILTAVLDGKLTACQQGRYGRTSVYGPGERSAAVAYEASRTARHERHAQMREEIGRARTK